MKNLLNVIIQDRYNNSTISFITLLFYRIENILYRKHLMGGVILFIVTKFHSVIAIVLGMNSQISYKAIIGKNIRFPHKAQGVVISAHARIGNNITIYHQVTIGINENKPKDLQRIIIKDRCYLSAGCKVISCIVGENCKIAPNVCVYKDLEPNCLAYNVTGVKTLQ